MSRFKYVVVAVMSAVVLFAAQAQNSQIRVTGFLTDTLSGRRGANAIHTDAAKRNVAAGMAQYAVYDEKTHKLYILNPQSSAEAYVCQRITVTGTLSASSMSHGAQTVDPNSNQVKDFHHPGQDSSTPVAGVLTIASMSLAPPGTPKPSSK